MSITRTCDKCGMGRQKMVGGEPVEGVVRYTLRRLTGKTYAYGNRTVRYLEAAGAIDLCDECWEKIAKPRMMAAKSHPRPDRRRKA